MKVSNFVGFFIAVFWVVLTRSRDAPRRRGAGIMGNMPLYPCEAHARNSTGSRRKRPRFFYPRTANIAIFSFHPHDVEPVRDVAVLKSGSWV